MKRLFGTDGIRGEAGKYPLDEATVSKIGGAFASVFHDRLGRVPRFVTGRDTRESGPAIEAAFHNGAGTNNATGESAGVITTPGVAFVTKEFGFDAGIVISASHNPFQDNGIKIFLPTGQKLEESVEQAIEEIVSTISESDQRTPRQLPEARSAEFQRAYTAYLRSHFSGDIGGAIKIVADCANGAASGFAEELLHGLGADVTVINAAPNGTNINKDCGSLHLEGLVDRVLKERADLGVAFDGDADRALFVDEKAGIVDGDAILWILANQLKERGELASGKVVATVMSNVGLEAALSGIGVEMVRAAVGDKYVLEELLRTGAEIGGEQSGHIILPGTSLVGDGMITALHILDTLSTSRVSLSQATQGFIKYPQLLVNIRVKEKRQFEEIPEITAAARKIEERLGKNGRLLLRYSGTEDLARVMIEGKDAAEIEALANWLADIIKQKLG